MTNTSETEHACAQVEEMIRSFMSEINMRFDTQLDHARYYEAIEHITDSVVALMEDCYAQGFEHGRAVGAEEQYSQGFDAGREDGYELCIETMIVK